MTPAPPGTGYQFWRCWYLRCSTAILPNNGKRTREHAELAARGGHLLQQLGMRDVPSPEGHLALEMEIHPEFANVRGALQGGLVAVLIDVCAGRLAYQSCDHAADYSTATSDLTVHYLSSVVVGPARAEARVVRSGRSRFVLQVDVTDAGRDHNLTVVSTLRLHGARSTVRSGTNTAVGAHAGPVSLSDRARRGGSNSEGHPDRQCGNSQACLTPSR